MTTKAKTKIAQKGIQCFRRRREHGIFVAHKEHAMIAMVDRTTIKGRHVITVN